MTAFTVRRRVLPLPILLIAFSGCSGSIGDQAADLGWGQPRVEKRADLGRLCEDPGDGYPEAAEYSGSGPHSVVMFNKAAGADTDRSTERYLVEPSEGVAEDATPIVSWHADSLKESVLLVCAEGQGKGKQLDSCDYERSDWSGPAGRADNDAGSDTLPIYSQDFMFTVYELATGERVHKSEFTATNGHFFASGVSPVECPTSVQYEDWPSELYAAPSAEDIHEELGDLVEGEAR